MKSSNLQIFKFVLIIFLFWKAILTFIAFFGLSNIPIRISDNEFIWASQNTDFWLRWANWDGGHFKSIAENGYIFSYQVVFFPLYPLLIKTLMFLNIPALLGGLIISNLSIIGALFFLYKLVNLDYEENISKRVVYLTLAFPTAFYFNAFYSESLFLFLTAASFYAARKNLWFYAFLLAAITSITRLTGLIVILALSLEYFLKTTKLPEFKVIRNNFFARWGIYLLATTFILSSIQRFFSDYNIYQIFWILKSILISMAILGFAGATIFACYFIVVNFDFKKILTLPTFFLILSLIPFGLYSFYLNRTQNNFLAFIPAQQNWDRYLTYPWNAPINYIRDILTQGLFSIGKTDQLLIEFMFFIFYLIAFFVSYFKLRLAYTVFFALSLIIPITTGTLQSIHRYGLVIFPVFILLALIKNAAHYYLWLFFSLTLLGILTVLFINGYWVT